MESVGDESKEPMAYPFPDEMVMEPVDTTIQIASMPATSNEEDDRMLFVELGDYVMITSKKYNGITRGTVYYRSEDLIRVKPDGVSDTLHDFELDQTEDEELYREEDGVYPVYVIRKRVSEAFTEQQDFRVGQLVDALGEKGDVTSYRVVGVDKENDAITLQEEADPEAERTIEFGYIGIKPEEGIRILSIREFVGADPANNNLASLTSNESEVQESENEEFENEEPEEFNEEQNKLNRIEMLGTVEIVKPNVYREAESYEQRIPDHLQKVDALNDFIHSLDPTLQKDPTALRKIRILVETLYLLNKETIEYNEEGEVVGPRVASVQHLSDLLTQGSIPLSRPVLRVSKRLYIDEDEDEDEEDMKDEDQIYKKDFVKELLQMNEHTNPLVASIMNGPSGSKTVIREWLEQQIAAKQYAPWVSDPLSRWSAPSDTEFFRSEPPATEEELNGSHTLLETVRGYMSPMILGNIPFGLERVLGPTYRKGKDRRKQLLLEAEKAPLEAYLLFPGYAIPYLGKKRSYDLATDSGRSQLPMKSMYTLLEELGEPVEKHMTAKNILLVRAVGGELGTIPLTSYIGGIHLPILGWADAFSTLVHYGLDSYELYPALSRVLKEKMVLAQAQVLTALARLREALESPAQAVEAVDKEKTSNELLPSTTIWESIASQEILSQALEEYQRRNPTLAKSDIGRTLFLTHGHDNLFQVTVGRTPLLIVKAVAEAYQKQYIDALRLQSIIRQREQDAGQPPKKNKCPHVSDMVSVRRLSDDAERFHELTKVFKRYQGERKDNWFHCNLCKETLLCIHERLQLQAYLHPKEKDVLEKEIILSCAGGQFQGKYICRNCGQGIRDLDFDNHTEYDDDGRPVMGRAPLEDDDALLEERMEDLIKAESEMDTQDTVWKMTPEEKRVYDVIRAISERVGIFLDQAGYKSILQQTFQFMNRLPPRNVYSKLKFPLDYNAYHARHLIACVSVFTLIEIQTKKPEYVVRYRLQGCQTTSFDGYPLDTDPSKRDGIQYLGCAVMSLIRTKTPIWQDTNYLAVPTDTKRMETILFYITGVLEKMIKEPTIQASLAEKRRYLTEVMGRVSVTSDDIPRDMVFGTFLPQMKMPTVAESAEDPLTPEIAERMGARGEQALVRLWIRRAHQFATESMAAVYGSPYLETTCCISSLTMPQETWSRIEDMPLLARRIWTPHVQGSALVTHFKPRLQDLAVAETDKELFYRVFLKYCFQGPRIGHTHELNLTNRCIWCKFQFPSHPSLMDAETEGKPALATQEVSTTSDDFTKLLDTIHTVYEVQPIPLPYRTGFTEVMAEFGSMIPSPVEGWSGIIGETMDAFLKIPKGLSMEEMRGEVILALGPLSQRAEDYKTHLQLRLSAKTIAVLEDIVHLPWNSFFQVLQTYILTLFSRTLSGFSSTSLFLPVELRNTLSEQHIEDLQKVLRTHYAPSSSIASYDVSHPGLDLAKGKLQYAVDQLRNILPFRDKIRALTLPGRQLTLEYLQRALLYGPLSTLIHPDHVPENVPLRSSIQEIGNHSISFLTLMIHASLEKYNKERLSYDEQTIKDRMADQAEKERVHVLNEFDKMTDEERAVEKLNKKLGIGKWAVGGTKLIYAYDKEYYDQERLRRLDAGMTDFPGISTGEELPPQGRMYDEMGLPVFSDQELEHGGGYDHAQHGEDD